MKSQWIGLALFVVVACRRVQGHDRRDQKPDAQESKPSGQSEERNTVRVPGDLQKKWGIEVARRREPPSRARSRFPAC